MAVASFHTAWALVPMATVLGKEAKALVPMATALLLAVAPLPIATAFSAAMVGVEQPAPMARLLLPAKNPELTPS